jgi:nitrogen fixation/metabolism regulation signal transduction histidine kinase
MTVKITKPSINVREKLSELDKETGIKGEELLRADTSAEAREALQLDQQLFTDFESTGIDDNATSTAVTIDSSGNLLVGSTILDQANNSNTANCGINLLESGIVSGSTNGTAVAYFNRLTSDGDIAVFRKNGTTVGSIGAI